MQTCPHCHQPIRASKPKLRPVLATSGPVNTLEMSESDARSYFKKTNRQESIRHKLTLTISAELRAAYLALMLADQNTSIQEAAFWRQYHALGNLWRGEANARERAAHLAAGHVLAPIFGDSLEDA